VLTPAQSAEGAQWVVERLTTFGRSVLSVVPSGFDAYARVFHPASRVTYTEAAGAVPFAVPLRWAEVAALTGRTAHRAMQWPSLMGEHPPLDDYTELKARDVVIRTPEEGCLPLEVAQALWPLLEPHTSTRDRCFFAVWEGFGDLPRTVLEAPAFRLPDRTFHLFVGPLGAAEKTFCADDPDKAMSAGVIVAHDPEVERAEAVRAALAAWRAAFKPRYQSPNLWWPADRAWCVATEIDLNTTYVAGARALIGALLACEGLEVYQVEPTDGVTYDSDPLNPPAADRHGGSFRLG
jgi:hypothetical protein